MTDALLGEEHRRIVDLLLGRLEEITDPDCRSPRVVVLRGHSGVGKTRIIQELYERLRSDRGDDYWPQMTPVVREPLGGGVDPMAARKLVAPVLDDFSWPAGVLPSFGWWGLNCERMAVGGHVDVLGAAQVQLAAHTLPLLLARRDEASVGDQLQRLGQDAVVQVQKVFKEEGKNALLELLKGIGVAFPFAGSVLSLGLNGLRVLGKRQENRARLGRDIDLGAESAWARRSAGEELAEALVGMAHTRLPAVLAVEDVHHMSEEVGRLLTTVASRSSAPVLVVATLWPEGQERPVYQDWLAQARERDLVEEVEVPPLAEEDLCTILRSYAPQTSQDTATEVVGRLSNPHLLKLWLTEERVRAHVAENSEAVSLSRDGLWLPESVKEVIAQRWKELDQVVRQGLVHAAALGEGQADPLCHFLPEVVTEVCSQGPGQGTKADLAKGLSRAVEPLSWCRQAEGTEWFIEVLLAEHVRGQAEERFDGPDRERLQRLAVQALTEWVRGRCEGINLPYGESSSLASAWYLALAGAYAGGEADVTVRAAATWCQAKEAAALQKWGLARKLSLEVVGLLERLGREDLRGDLLVVRAESAMWLFRSGEVKAALVELRETVGLMRQELGSEELRTLTARADLLEVMVAAGDGTKAVPLYKDLLTVARRVCGVDSERLREIKSGYAQALMVSGQVVEASDVYQELARTSLSAADAAYFNLLQVEAVGRAKVEKDETIKHFRKGLDETLRTLPADHPLILVARENLAKALERYFQYEQAIQEFQIICDAQTRLLGVSHPDTLKSRFRLAEVLRKSGHVDRAEGLFRELLSDMVRVLGADHPDTLNTRNHLASAVREQGRLGEAEGLFRELLSDMVRVLGADHPHTLNTRNHLAFTVREQGRLGEAEGLYQQLLSDMVRVLGADHLYALSARGNLASAVREQGRLGEAEGLFRELLADRLRVLGADHPDTLTTRGNLAFTVREQGRLGEAEGLYQQLLADRLRVLGADHPDTLTTRGHLALAVREQERLGEAEGLFRELLADVVRVLGADHLYALSARGNLASAVREQGRLGEAEGLFRELLADRLRVLGADHPDTLNTRNHLASAVREQERLGEAEGLFRELLADVVRVLGADHPHTLTTRGNLAFTVREQGRLGEAEGLYQQLLADEVRVLGADHPDTLTTRGLLASAVREQGRLGEAEGLYQQLLADRLRVLGADHPDTLTTRGNLASAVREQGRLGEAEGLFRELLSDMVRVLGADHPHTLTTRGNLASAVREQGRLQEAEGLYQQLLADRLRVLGADHPDTLTTRGNLASAVREQERLGEAEGLFRELLSDMVRVLGADHPHTLTTRGNLAFTVREQGRLGEAEGLYQQLLADEVRVLGADHPDTLTTRGLLASAVREQGRLGEAEGLYQQLLADRLRVLGADHPDTLTTRHNLSMTLWAAGQRRRAIEELAEVAEAMESAGRNKKATDVRKRILEWTQAECGKGSPESLEARFDLAYALEECKEPVEAAKHYSIVLEGQLRLYGSTAPDTLDTRNNLAVALHSSNQLSEAIQEYEVLLADLESLPEPDPEFVDTVRSRLEQWRQEQQGGTD